MIICKHPTPLLVTSAAHVLQVWQALGTSQPQLVPERTLRAVHALAQQLEALSSRTPVRPAGAAVS